MDDLVSSKRFYNGVKFTCIDVMTTHLGWKYTKCVIAVDEHDTEAPSKLFSEADWSKMEKAQ